MKLQIQPFRLFIYHKVFWVFVTIGCLATLHLYYFWKITNNLPSLIDFLGWGSIFFLLWNRQYKIKFRGGMTSSILGLFLVVWMVLRHSLSQFNTSVDVLAYFFPVITFVGILLITTGFKRLKSYKSEILIATLISLPFASIYNLFKPIINIDAQLLNFMLHYFGFNTVRQGALVSLPNGSVSIMPSCSSVGPILTMMPFVIVLLSLYPTSKSKQFFVYISTISAIIFVNSIRLSLLAILLNKGDIAYFNYWHTGGGAGIFSNIIVFIVAGISYQILNSSSKSSEKI